MASSTENVKLGVCTVLFDGEDLGFTKGGVEVEVATSTHEVTVDQFGETPVNELVMGRTVNVTIPLAETTLENMVKIMPGAELIQEGGAKATGTVTFSTAAPANNDAVTIAGVAFTFKTVPAGAYELAIPASFTAAGVALAAAVIAAGLGLDAVAAAGVVTLTARSFGALSNAITLTKAGVNIAVSGATFTGGVNPTKAKVVVTTGVSISLLGIAKKLVLRPKGTSGADDFTVFKAMTGGALKFAYQVDNERIFNTVFKGYALADGRLFAVGDESAAA